MFTVFIVTKNGIILKVKEDQFRCQKRAGQGVKAISLDFNDKVVGGISVTDSENVTILTKYGKSITISGEELKSLNRGSRGVKAITLIALDEVVAII